MNHLFSFTAWQCPTTAAFLARSSRLCQFVDQQCKKEMLPYLSSSKLLKTPPKYIIYFYTYNL